MNTLTAFLTELFTALMLAVKNVLLQTTKEEIREFHDKALVWQEESGARRRKRVGLFVDRVKDRAQHRKACRHWRWMERACEKYERKQGAE